MGKCMCFHINCMYLQVGVKRHSMYVKRHSSAFCSYVSAYHDISSNLALTKWTPWLSKQSHCLMTLTRNWITTQWDVENGMAGTSQRWQRSLQTIWYMLKLWKSWVRVILSITSFVWLFDAHYYVCRYQFLISMICMLNLFLFILRAKRECCHVWPFHNFAWRGRRRVEEGCRNINGNWC